MENKEFKIRINLEQREVELSGDSDFIEENFGALIKEYLEIIKSSKTQMSNHGMKSETIDDSLTSSKLNQQSDGLPSSFGEYFNRFSKSISNVDKLLIASYFSQSKNDSKQFTVADASSLLIEQGVKLSNASSFNKANHDTKRIFKLSGKNFRVSDSGIEYIKSL